MTDSLRPLRELPKATQWLATLLVAIISIVTSLAACIVYAQGFVREPELQSVMRAHKREHVAEALKRDDEDKKVAATQLEERRALFRRLVSLEAADVEPDRRKAMGAATYARKSYDDAVYSRGMTPEKAAQYALDDSPPWRR